ncbi:MAG: hypothetical protein FIA99_02635 [Ruminiclostridium sp.]|nr:hypothetical protein [Ruminiclostridium sp.]
MKSNIFKRLMAVSIAAIMSVSLFACGSKQGGTTESSSTAASSESTESSPSTTAVDKTPITLTIGMGSTLSDGTHQDNSVFKEIEAQTGVTLSFVNYDVEKFKVLSAGGDLPDIFRVFSATAPSLIESGALLPLDDLLDKYGQNIKQNIPIALKWSKQVAGKGKTYLLPAFTTVADTSSSIDAGPTFNTRYDIYKAVGSPKMSGEDDYLNVLKQMQDYQRKATGDKKIYALSAWSDWGLWVYLISYPFAHGYTNSALNHFVNRETGVIESGLTAADGIFWKGLKFFNKAYRMGIFDPEAFTMKYGQYEAKVKAGTVLVADAQWFSLDATVLGDKAVLVQLAGAFPVLTDVYTAENPIGYQMEQARAINASTKYPERAMQLLNYFDSVDGARTLFNGIKGVDWDVVGGKAQLIGPRLEALKNGTINDYAKANPTGIDGETYAAMGSAWTSGEFKTPDGLPLNLKNTTEFKQNGVPTNKKSFAQDFDPSFSYPGQVYAKWVKDGLAKTISTYPFAAFIIPPASAENEQISNKAAEYYVANMAKIIMAKDDATFDSVREAVIKEVMSMGMEAVNAEYKKNYESAEALANTLK